MGAFLSLKPRDAVAAHRSGQLGVFLKCPLMGKKSQQLNICGLSSVYDLSFLA